MSVGPIGSGIIGQRCMLSDEGGAMLGRRRHQKLDRTGTIVGLKGDNYVVHWDDNAKETVKPLKFAAIRRASSRVSAAKKNPSSETAWGL